MHYNDELDEEFEEKINKKITEQEFEQTINSFELPKGLEEMPNSILPNGPDMDQKDIDALRQRIQSMPANKIQELMANLSMNNFGLGNNKFSSVSDDHRIDARERLRQKLAQKKFGRKSQIIKKREIEKHQKEISKDTIPNYKNDNDINNENDNKNDNDNDNHINIKENTIINNNSIDIDDNSNKIKNNLSTKSKKKRKKKK